MGYAVGVDFGSVLSTAGIVKWDNDCPQGTESVRVAGPVPSAAYVDTDNELHVGTVAHQQGVLNPQRVIRDFTRRLGDPVPIMVGEWIGQTEDIIAAGIRQLVDAVAAEEGGPPDAVAVTHPASWGPYKQELLAGALAGAGLADVMLVSEPQAAAENTARFAPGTGRTVVVYDLGGGSFQAAVMARVGDGGFTKMGQSQALDWLGGSDFDQAIFSRIQRTAGLQREETTDQAVLKSLGQLRRDCTVAKELLSVDTEVTVTVLSGGRRSRIRLVRSEFEELIRDAIEDTVDATRRSIQSAGLSEQDIDAVVLAGGSSRIPLVAQVISAEFGRPIVVDASPEASTSLGAAWLAARALRVRSAESADLDVSNDVAEQPADQLRTDQLPTDQLPMGESSTVQVPPGHLPTEQPIRPPDVPAPAAPVLGEAAPAGPRHAGPTPAAAPDASMPAAATDASTPAAAPAGPTTAPQHRSGKRRVGPAGRRAQPDRPAQPDGRGRHRRRARRYWIRVAGTVAAAAVIISAGSAIATSQASDGNSPGGGQLSNPVGAPAATSTGAPAATAGTNASNAVGAPAVIVGRSEPLPTTEPATGPASTEVTSATP